MRIALVSLVLALLGGCLHFVDSADVNLKIDPYFASHNFILSGASAYAQDISGLVGRITYKDSNGSYVFMNVPLLENAKVPQVKAVQSAYSYTSIVDKGYTFSASVPFLAPDLTGHTATSYELRDVAWATVDTAGEPSRPQFQVAATAAGAPADRPWFWVRTVVLADLRQQQSVNLNGQTTVTGTGFSANGQIFDNPSASAWIPLVSVDAVPMNTLADNEVGAHPAPPAEPVRPGGHLLSTPIAPAQYLLERPPDRLLVPASIK